MTRISRWSVAVAGVLAVMVALAAWLARPARPGAFYRMDTVQGVPGQLLRAERVTLDGVGDARIWRFLYVTTRDDGTRALASGLALAPAESATAASGDDVVLWMHGTTGVAPGCAPSLLAHPFAHAPALPEALARGWRVVAPDYPGLGVGGRLHGYLIGTDEARSGLDAVRAARDLPGFGPPSSIVAWGHSQGGHAALWVGIEGPTYAPELPLAGVAAMAPASDLRALVRAAQGSLVGRILSSYIVAAYAADDPAIAAHSPVRPGARQLADAMAGQCLAGRGALWALVESALARGSVFDADPGTGELGRQLARNTPDRPIAVPLLIAQGGADELVRPSIQRAFVRSRCAAGQALAYRTYPGRDHLSLVAPDSPLVPDLLAWTADRFAGRPAATACP